MRKVIALTVIAAITILWSQPASAQKPTSDPIKLRMSAAWPPPDVSMTGETIKWWVDEVTKRTNGRVTIETFWMGSIAAPAEQADLLKQGAVDLIQTVQWYTPSKFPIAEFEFVFPFGPTDYTLVAKAKRQIRGEFPEFVKDEANQKAVMISDLPIGTYCFLSKKPLKTIEDFKGEKVSLVGRYFGRWLPPGATAVVRPGTERYDLLHTGVVSTDLLPFDTQYAVKVHEVTNYYIAAKILTACAGPILMNIDKFNALPPDIQKVFLEAGKDAELIVGSEIAPRWFGKVQEAWKQRGIVTIDFPDTEVAKWTTKLEDIPAEWAAEVEGQGYPGWKIVQRWQEITTEMGFKWSRKWGLKK